MPAIECERCDNGFQATVVRVVLIPRGAVQGSEIEFDPFPPDYAETEMRARGKANARFKAWAAIQNLSNRVCDRANHLS